MANEEKRSEGSEHEADSVRPDDPLFVPRLDLLLRARGLSEEERGRDLYSWAVETICGATDDSQPVEQYGGNLGVSTAFVNSRQGAVAQVQWNNNLATIYTNPGDVSGVRWGSGTMISADLFLTCGHLFDQTGGGWQRPRQNGTNNIISPQEIARNMHLNFNFQVDSNGNQRPEQSFAITELIEYRLGGVDFAVCRIAGNPGNTFGRTRVSTVDAAVNDMLCIIGHPAGLPKRVEAGPASSFSGNQINYNDIDTLGGNSGSGILHSNGSLAGVHTNGGCNAAGTGSNFGMRISAVRAQSPTLRTLYGGRTPAAAAWGSNRLDIFGLGLDKQMFHKAWAASWYPSPAGWEALGGRFNSPPAVASWGDNRLDIFGLGTDYQMYHKAWAGGWHPSPTGWEALGGRFNSPPAVASWGSGRLDIFGLGTDNQMYHKAWAAGWYPSPTGWEALGGRFNSPPAVVSWGDGRLDIFALGTDDQMFHKAWSNGWYPSPTAWEPLGGRFTSVPAVAAWGYNRLDIFGLGTDLQMYHKAWGGSWYPSPTGWEPLGGRFNSPPAVVSWGDGRLDIFALGTDDQMFHKAWSNGWYPSPTAWEPLGGAFTGP